MSIIDMKQFHQVFFEESQEHLDEMEQQLLGLDLHSPDPEALNCIFRAAHSIKGGSGIFGFDALSSLTHILENLLDNIRQGKMQVTAARVDVFLRSVDQLKNLLDAYRSEQAPDWGGCQVMIAVLEAETTGQSAQATDQEEGARGYGFYQTSAVPESAESEAFGFFDDIPVSPEHANNEIFLPDDGFGFFTEDEPASILPANTPEAAVAVFFDDLLEPQALNKERLPPEDNTPIAIASGGEKSKEKPNLKEKIIAKEQPSLRGQQSLKEQPSLKEQAAPESSSIRVDVAKVDQLINLVGEIVITQSMMSLLSKNLQADIAEKFHAVTAELERNTREIQDAVMSIRMLPVSFVFNRFPRLVRDLSVKLGKTIELLIEGGETELDKGLTEKLVDPLTHLVRNSIDHGIETTENRISLGKPAAGRVILRAAQQGGSIVISISDDGAGLNREKILQKAHEKNLPVSDNPSDEEVWQLIFSPGFSTAAEVTDVSGRGVGMDVVKRNVQRLGGRIDIESHAGEGACFTIRLPLTLAILDGMCVAVGGQTFIVPLVHILESMQPGEAAVSRLAGEDQLLHVRNHYWPIIALHSVMQIEPRFTRISEGIVILIETDKQRFALFVDDLLGQQQVVIKSLEQHYKRVEGVAGATIMGDGSVALILDVESLAGMGRRCSTTAVAS